jgi:uncharacterized membrane protein
MKNSQMILKRIDGLLLRVDQFNVELKGLKGDVQQSAIDLERDQREQASTPPPAVTPQIPAPESVVPKAPEATPLPPAAAVPPPMPRTQQPAAPAHQPQQQQPVAQPNTQRQQQPRPAAQPPRRQAPPVRTPLPPKKSFYERNPNLEKLVGEKLFPLIGIFVLVTGIGFFVSWAIEHDYINEIGRAGIGILSGGILIGVAHWMRKKYHAFSSILLGGGIATLFFTVTYAHKTYELFGPADGQGQVYTFAILVLLTIFTIVSALFYDRKEIAILGLIGGFATPLLVATGAGNHHALFIYMILLNVGMAVLAYFKNWKVINILSFLFTVVIFGCWAMFKTFDNALPYADALTYATAFFTIFFIMNIVYNVTKKVKFKAWEYIILLMNTFAYFGAGLYILDQVEGGMYKGLFTGIVGIFHFMFAFALYKKDKLDKNLVYTLIGLVLTFITLAGPIQLNGNFITLFWAAEAVLLLWMSQRSKISLLKTASVVVTICVVVSLVMDWINVFGFTMFYSDVDTTMPIIFNKMFITTLVSVASLIFTNILLRREKEDNELQFFGISLGRISGYRAILPFITTLVIYVGGLLEVIYQVGSRTDIQELSTILITMYHLVIGIGVYAYVTKYKNQAVDVSALFYSIILLACYALFTHPATIDLRNMVASAQGGSSSMFLLHYVNTFLLFGLLYFVGRQFKTATFLKGFEKFFVWASTVILLFVFCTELDHLMVYAMADPYTDINVILSWSHKAGYPIVWGATAFALIMAGLKRKHFQMRLVGLSLLGFTILKIFAIDVWEMPQLGRILAFVSLGLLILIISFMYQRLRRLLFVEEEANEAAATALAASDTSTNENTSHDGDVPSQS